MKLGYGDGEKWGKMGLDTPHYWPFQGLNIVLRRRDDHHSIRRELLPNNGGLTFLAQILKFRIYMTPYFRI